MLAKPKTPHHLYYFGNISLEQGKFANAEKAYIASIKLGYDKAKIYNNLGIAQKSMGDFNKAYESFKKAIKLDPMLVEAYNNLGNIQIRLNLYDEAIKTFLHALVINPYYKDVYNNLGTVWHGLGQTQKAITCYKKAMEINAAFPDAHNNLGVALQNISRLKTAIKSYKQAISLRPNFAEAYFNLASTYHDLGDTENAVKYASNALSIFPNYQDALHLSIQQNEVLCNWKEVEKLMPTLNKMTSDAIKNNYKSGEIPFFSISNFDDPNRNYQVARLWSKFLTGHLPTVNFDSVKRNNKSKNGVLNIGYVSSDFRDNVIAHQFVDVFRYHNKTKFKVFAYSCGPNDRSYYRKAVEKYTNFRDVANISYIKAAELVYKDEIDILIDLNGYTRGAKLEISALRPAPIRAHYLGFPGTVAADFFDYIITDKIITPPSASPYYSEKFVYMPNCYQAQSYSRYEKNKNEVIPERVASSSFIFCSFNNNYKITKPIFLSWMNILKKTPNSILWLVKERTTSQNNLLNEANKAGVSPDRITFTKRVSLESHLNRIPLASLALDTYPYNGGATTSNTLWSGVPVVTLQGKTYITRMSSSLLTAAGIPELITSNIKDYEKLAVSLAKNPEKIKRLKQTLLSNRDTKPLFNTKLFVKNLEKAYIAMWQNYKKGNKPKTLNIR
jgi:protein O-GlcNAc transferase